MMQCHCGNADGPAYGQGLHATWDCPLSYIQKYGWCPGFLNENYNFLQFSQDFSLEKYRAFLFRKLRRAWPGLSGSFCACALKLTADTEHGVATGPPAYHIDSVSRRAGRYLET